jgi:hypothetical protein
LTIVIAAGSAGGAFSNTTGSVDFSTSGLDSVSIKIVNNATTATGIMSNASAILTIL